MRLARPMGIDQHSPTSVHVLRLRHFERAVSMRLRNPHSGLHEPNVEPCECYQRTHDRLTKLPFREIVVHSIGQERNSVAHRYRVCRCGKASAATEEPSHHDVTASSLDDLVKIYASVAGRSHSVEQTIVPLGFESPLSNYCRPPRRQSFEPRDVPRKTATGIFMVRA